MAYEKLKDHLSSKLVGVGSDRIAIRTQGCWNCVHADPEKAAKLWWEKARQQTLERGVAISLASPLGENDDRVRAIRRDVPLIDAQVTQNVWIACDRGKKPDGQPVGNFVHNTYLCDRWTAKEGASVAREGAGPDKLPEELFERFTDEGKTD